ncbi:MAG: efflux RND transporter permease subunit [Myxococcales bacterium]|nr:efflux RND transporter permease subunit [Myxococcales bacterium]
MAATETPSSPAPAQDGASEQDRASAAERFFASVSGFLIDNKLVALILLGLLIGAGLSAAPFRWQLGSWPRDPVAVDALPDISENQQIVFTNWPGRSPRDVEDQITYPLSTALLGIPGVKSVRASSVFGFSSIYLIFEEDVDFYWSRSRVLEKLASLPAGTLPPGVAPALGPDATALGQVFWYTLEPRFEDGSPAPGLFDLHELRSVQDWIVRYGLMAVSGVSEVASVGGHVREYQVDVDPHAMLAAGVNIGQVAAAVKKANLDVGARTVEINRVEYVVRGLGFIERVEDIEEVVIASREHTPIRVKDVARVGLGPAARRGALDKDGAPAVGGVVVVRFGDNPMRVIEGIRKKVAQLAPGLPRRTAEDGRSAQVQIVPFYDRTVLIEETLGTLSETLTQQILITVIVVLLVLGNLRMSLLVSVLLPLGVLGTFVAMRYFGVAANVMALSGIAIAIGTMVDMGIVLNENMLRHLQGARGSAARAQAIGRATGEVAPAILTAVLTTVVGFLPVFGLTEAEGKLFSPLAYTKTFALLSSFAVSVLAVPALAHLLLRDSGPGGRLLPARVTRGLNLALSGLAMVLLADYWKPLGAGSWLLSQVAFVAVFFGLAFASFWLLQKLYVPLLRLCLKHKLGFLFSNLVLVAAGLAAWLGVPGFVRGLESDFMPPFDEGSFLYMPTTTPHASLGQALELLSTSDAAIAAIPEVESAIGKIGRADTPLDPAPISMLETVVNYKPEYRRDAEGRIGRYRFDEETQSFPRDPAGEPIADPDGRPFRQWRDHIHSPADIWREISEATVIPGLTGAPKLMPIKTRIVMLQTGMRSAVGLKIQGPDLATLEGFALQVERLLTQVPEIAPSTVLADRIVGKPYLEIDIDRAAIARYGLSIEDVQNVIQIAVGGRRLTSTVEGRERYPVRVRYMREQRDSVEALRRVLVPTRDGQEVPLSDLASFAYSRGPQMIRSEDTFLTAYVTFDPREGIGEVESVEAAAAALEGALSRGELSLPAGVSYRFAGTYENQLRTQARLSVLVPVALAIIFLLLYLQFRATSTALMVFSGVALAAAGGFLLLSAYGQPWFLGLDLFGLDLRQLLQIRMTRLTVAVWVGFLALFGIATDNGVIIATYLKQRFRGALPADCEAIHDIVVAAGERRLRPCLMTTATTGLALLPILTSTGRGSDLMIPMALPTVGGIGMTVLALLTVPVLFSIGEERKLRARSK